LELHAYKQNLNPSVLSSSAADEGGVGGGNVSFTLLAKKRRKTLKYFLKIMPR